MKYLSLFSGIEAASVAWEPLGFEPMAFADIEPFPSAVLAHRFLHVPNLGDITEVDWEKWKTENGSPDVMVAGSPCQAFSVAGKRRSLEDARGNLTLFTAELVRFLEPRVFLWENVPGVLNTKDNAFGSLLGELVGADTPLVPDGRWSNAGVVVGPERRLAWRVLDAQWFGVAQRRRRVFVVACPLSGPDPVSILFEPEGVRRHTPPSREPREGTTKGSADRTGSSGGEPHGLTAYIGTQHHGKVEADVAGPLTCGQNSTVRGDTPVVTVLDRAGNSGAPIASATQQGGAERLSDLCPTITASAGMAGNMQPWVCNPEPRAVCIASGHTNAEIGNDICTTQTARQYKDAPIVMAPSFSKRPGQQIANRQDDTCYAITTGEPPRVLDRASFNQGENAQYELLVRDVYNGTITGDVAATLTAASGEANTSGPKVLTDYKDEQHTYREGSFGQFVQEEIGGTIKASGGVLGGGSESLVANLTPELYENHTTDRHAISIQDCVRTKKQQNGLGVSEEDTAYTLDTTGAQGIGSAGTVRRLTPLETERLQGFPDNWTQISWRGKSAEDCPDGPRYKACGNSMAVPVMRWLGARIAAELTGAEHTYGIPEGFRNEVESR